MNEELKKAYEGIEDDLELVEYEGFYNHIKEWNFIKNYITNLQQENARLKEKNKKVIDKLEYYNSGEALWYVPIQEIIDILEEN